MNVNNMMALVIFAATLFSNVVMTPARAMAGYPSVSHRKAQHRVALSLIIQAKESDVGTQSSVAPIH